MEEMKLNLNTPLLSVRRNLSSASMNASSLLKERTDQTSTPRNQRKTLFSRNVDWRMDQVKEPVSVPFTWEEVPGKARDDGEPENHLPEKTVYPVPMIVARNSSSIHDDSLEELRERSQSEKGSVSDDDERYSDAADTLSPAASFSVSNSIGSLGESDGTVMKPSGTFSIDRITREFMMGRFLPAARAMSIASESSLHHASRQPQLLLTEQPTEVEKSRFLAAEGGTPSRQHHMAVVKYCTRSLSQIESSKEEEEEGGGGGGGKDDRSEYGATPEKGCGLLPHLCLTSSLRLLNPVPGLKSKIKHSMPFVPAIRKDMKAKSIGQSVFKSGGPLPKSEDRVETFKGGSPRSSYIVPLLGRKSQHNFSGNLRTAGRLSPFRPSRNDIVTAETRDSSPLSCTAFPPGESSSHKMSRLSPYRPRRNDVANPEKIELPRPSYVAPPLGELSRRNFSGELRTVGRLSPFMPSRDDALASRKEESSQGSYLVPPLGWPGRRNFSGEMQIQRRQSSLRPQRDHGSALETDEKIDVPISNKANGCIRPASPAFERTLYVDTVNEDHDLCLNLNMLDRDEVWMDPMASRDVQETFMGKSSFQDIECLKVVSLDRSVKEIDNGVVDPLSLPLPLLKAPSDSWLWHALPSKSDRSLLSSLQKTTSKKHISDAQTIDSKWETIVKTSKTHHDHTRYSEELIEHVPRQYKS
ncbi:hypothetical protein MLD38_019294 [Melastoma candidum]|uniref:Uncharacterized protein n=1 Tax=Melastoma candidum TaxID=119954 RepID=A0ACB9QX47_9MYRT|nr:hypothetical protein MLD38_019294 [Melastoma candidum]